MNKEQLKQIVKSIDEIGEELEVTFSSDMVLDCATRIYNSEKIENGSKETKEVKEERKTINPITDKQRRLLTKALEQGAWNGQNDKGERVDLDKMSKQEAFYIIQALMGK
jgi:hypothetical protein